MLAVDGADAAHEVAAGWVYGREPGEGGVVHLLPLSRVQARRFVPLSVDGGVHRSVDVFRGDHRAGGAARALHHNFPQSRHGARPPARRLVRAPLLRAVPHRVHPARGAPRRLQRLGAWFARGAHPRHDWVRPDVDLDALAVLRDAAVGVHARARGTRARPLSLARVAPAAPAAPRHCVGRQQHQPRGGALRRGGAEHLSDHGGGGGDAAAAAAQAPLEQPLPARRRGGGGGGGGGRRRQRGVRASRGGPSPGGGASAAGELRSGLGRGGWRGC
mmetsp:Transcript_17979/g.58688  ORF Transcript_17979/g.58688 Transcript_17979/m.58688 type:complete len:274 (-) Transcript_17979:527-1348(-)